MPRKITLQTEGAIHSTKISGNFGPKLNGSVQSNRKSFGKTGPPFEVVHFSRSDRSEFWLNGSRPDFPFVFVLIIDGEKKKLCACLNRAKPLKSPPPEFLIFSR